MKRFFLPILAALLAFTGVIALAPPARACSCAELETPLDELARVNAVFAGQIILIEESPPRADGTIWSSDPTTVTLAVDEIWKGPTTQTIVVTTEREGDSCGYDFVVDKRYLVYALDLSQFTRGIFAGRSGLHASLCSRTQPLAAATADLAALGDGSAPVVKQSPVGAAPPSTSPDSDPIGDLVDWLRELWQSITVASTAPPAAAPTSAMPTSPLAAPSVASSEISFPTNHATEAYTQRDANGERVEGTLALVHGCLGITTRYAPDGILVIWPPEYVLDATSDPVAIRDRASGELVAQLGDEVSLGGGHVYLGQARDIAGESLPDACALPVAQSDNFFIASPTLRAAGQTVSPASPFPTVTLATDGQPTRPLRTSERELSPRGDWVASVRTDWPDDSEPLNGFYIELRVTSADDSIEYLPLAEQRNYGLGYITPGIVGWSPSGRYLYFTERPHPDGCAVFADASGLWRLDVQDGAIESLLDSSSSARLSPDALQVAYTLSGSSELTLLDLRSGDRRRVELEMNPQSDAAGGIVWSPDSQSLALTVAHYPCSDYGTHSIVRIDGVDNDALLTATLLDRNKSLLTTVDWYIPDQINLRDKNGQPSIINSVSGELTPTALPIAFEEAAPPLHDAFDSQSVERRANVVDAPAVPVDHSIPSDICAGHFNSYDCALAIEENQRQADVPQFARDEQTGQLLLTLGNGDLLTFTDVREDNGTALYSYQQFLAEIEQHLLRIQYFEGSSYLLVNDQTGVQTHIVMRPILSPDSRRFVTTFGRPGEPLFVSIWRIDEEVIHEQTLRVQAAQGPGALGPVQVVSWSTANRVEVEVQAAPYVNASGGTIAIELSKAEAESRGAVRITFNGIEMKRPVLDERQARYASHEVYDIGVSTVGSLVYADRDYVFTALPDVVADQQYLLFNDNMHRTDADYARLHLYQPATLYAAIDADACALPGWLSAWEPVGDVVETSDLPLALYRHDFAAGEVLLGGNEMSPAACVRSHYVIFVVANDKS